MTNQEPVILIAPAAHQVAPTAQTTWHSFDLIDALLQHGALYKENNEIHIDEKWLHQCVTSNTLPSAVFNALRKLSKENSLEGLDIVEALALAVAPFGYKQVTQKICQSLTQRFPQSFRVKRLTAQVLHEAEGDYEKAIEIYQSCLDADENDTISAKRMILALASQRDTLPAALNRLSVFLDLYALDTDALWIQHRLQLRENQLSQAAETMASLLVIVPHSTTYILRFADILYTLSTPESVALALKYYARAIELSPDNIRALLGVRTVIRTWRLKYAQSNQAAKWVPTKDILDALFDRVQAQLEKVYIQRASSSSVRWFMKASVRSI